jgi:hypothetical protein
MNITKTMLKYFFKKKRNIKNVIPAKMDCLKVPNGSVFHGNTMKFKKKDLC